MDQTEGDLLKTIDATMLTPLVRRTLNRASAKVLDWQASELYGGGITTKIMRFSGNALDGGTTHPWSLVLKIIRPHDKEDDPESLRYWKREALAYQSGLLDNLPGNICAPRCYEVIEYPEREVWLWLEEIVEDAKGTWSLEQFGNVARHIGEFNGSFYENKPSFSYPWMIKNQLRVWLGDEAPILPPSVLAHPFVKRLYSPANYEWMQRVWSEHSNWLDILDRQSKTLSHLDVFRRNAFARRDTKGNLQTVLIDWAFVGGGTPGEEIAPLVAGSLNFMGFDSTRARELDQIVFDMYIEGLRSAGWRGDPRIVRFAYAVGSILKFSIGVHGVAFMIADKDQQAILEQIFGHPIEELVDAWGATASLLVKLSGEARELASQI
jgi:hypothetical protein